MKEFSIALENFNEKLNSLKIKAADATVVW